ncbi:MAG: Dabb family protein [Mucilaginibacter sp.]
MKLNNVFVHQVYFWLKNEADQAKLIEGINTLAAIKGLKQIHIGVTANTPREVVDNTYHASLLTIFDNKEAHDVYQDDPIHHEFLANYVKPLVAKVVVMDSVDPN